MSTPVKDEPELPVYIGHRKILIRVADMFAFIFQRMIKIPFMKLAMSIK